MRVSVDAILVIRRGGDHLAESLKALTQQTRPVDRLCVVDTSADSSIQAQIDMALQGSQLAPLVVSIPYRSTWAEAIGEGVVALFPEGAIPDTAWVWLLRDDTLAHPEALSTMTLSVEGSPMVKVAGPKQRMMDQPLVIREMGETMSRFGERMALAERELDQAQYDRLSDVLAVGEAGMFLHAATLQELEGFDQALSPLDGGLDLGVRARLAGHRVVVIPRAIVHVGSGPADWHFGKQVTSLHQNYLSRRAWLYRRFVYAPLWALLPLLVWALPWALLRGIAAVLAKHPDRIVAEIAAALWALSKVKDVLAAREVLLNSRATSWATIDSLRLSPADARKRRAITREARQAEAEEKAQLQPSPAIFPALPWLLVILTVIAGLTHGRWWGADFVAGGGALPLPATLGEVWASVWLTTPTQLSLGAPPVPADPAQLLFAVLGTLTWWSPSLALVALFVVAIPLAGLSAWWGASQFLSKSWTTGLVAGLWAVTPTFLFALSEGRVGAVIAHIALPWLVGAALSAHESWQRVGQLSLAAVIVLAAAPVLWPAVAIGLVALGLVRMWSQPFRMFVGVLPLALAPSVLLGWPRFAAWWDAVGGRWWEGWGALLADPGKAIPYVPSVWWEMAAGWPVSANTVGSSLGLLGLNDQSASILVAAAALPLVVLAVLSLTLGRIQAAGTFAGLFSLGLVTAVSAPALFAGYEGFQAVSVWAGTGVSLLVLGVLLGAGSTLDRVEFEDSLGNPTNGLAQWSARIAGAVVITVGTLQIVPFSLATWSGETLVQSTEVTRSLPAFVAAEAVANPNIGTLVIEQVGEAFDVTLERGAGPTLSSTSTLLRARSTDITPRDEDLARLVAALVRPTAAEPGPLLQAYGIRFIWLKAPATSEAALTISQLSEVVSASSAEAGQLWQVPSVNPAKPSSSERLGVAGGLLQQLFWLMLGVGALLAIPTERRSRAGARRADDALPSLGEETSDNDS
jgi:GT2 family glycosyltransferase